MIGDVTDFSFRKITFRCRFVPNGDSEYSYATNVVNAHDALRSYAFSAASRVTFHTGATASVQIVLPRQKPARPPADSAPIPSPRNELSGDRYALHASVSYTSELGVVQRLTSPRYSA